MPAFGDDESLDLDATAAWIDDLIGRGMRLFWTTFGTSHYLSLDDAEIDALTAAVASVTRGRAVFIASTQFHWPLHRSVAFAEHAARQGADAIKVQIDWRLQPADEVVLERYRTLAAASPLPLLAYALGGGTFGAGAGGPRPTLFRGLLELPQIVGMKNDAGDFYEQTAYLAAAREAGRPEFAVITGGSMESMLHGRRFGQRAYAVGLAMHAPELVARFDRAIGAGDGAAEAEAVGIVRDVEQRWTAAVAPLGHWAAYHEGLRLLGRFPSRRVRFPLRTLTDPEAAVVERAMRDLGLLAAVPR
jgi:dihydrodipicolinate synthase/N-acetylneuraminate lyase